MRLRPLFLGAAAFAGVALAPNSASAVPCTPNVYSVTLGIGGAIFGCANNVIATQLFENAALVSRLWWFKNVPGPNPATGEPIGGAPGINDIFYDEAGSTGADGGKYFCGQFGEAPQPFGPYVPASGTTPGTCDSPKILGYVGTQTTDELVFGLQVPQPPPGNGSGVSGTWEYSGANDGRNNVPAPPGFQAILLQNTDHVNTYVLLYEDLNSGCTGATPNPTTVTDAQLGNKAVLNSAFHNCSSGSPGASDQDFNDFYVTLLVQNGRLTDIVPEPGTMSLLALGLVGMAGAGIRRRNRNK